MQKPTHDDVYRFVRENSTPFVKTADVVEEFDDVTRRTLNNRLNQLAKDGKIEKRLIGGNAAVWFTES